MEPVSILSAAAAISAVAGKAWELGSFVRELCQGAKTVDGRVRRLESAVTELARACEHVQGQFESMAPSSSSETSTLAWDEQGALTASIEIQVKDCHRTLKELRKLLTELRPSGNSFFGRTSRHVKLQDRGQQISDFSMRIKTHTDTLQMSLQIVIIRIALATPDFLLRQLGAALEDLRVRLSRIEINSKPSTSRFDGGEAHGVQFMEHAREALRSGTTLYEASTAGSVADVEPVTDTDRVARIKEWANNMEALRENPKEGSDVAKPDTLSAHVCTETDSGEKVVEDPSHASSPEASVDSSLEGQPVSEFDTNSVAPIEARHTNILASDDEKSSIPEPLASNLSGEPNFIATDYADHATVGGNEITVSSMQPLPGRLNPETCSLHISSNNSTLSYIDRWLDHDSHAMAIVPKSLADGSDALQQDVSTKAGMPLRGTDEAKHIPFRYPMENSLPLDRTAREHFIATRHFRIAGQLEAKICTGEHIEPAVLSELAAADQAGITVQSSNTTGEQQKGRSHLALLLAVYFRDTYLIKPLVELGFEPDVDLSLGDGRYETPIAAAIQIRCEPVIQELLENGAKLTYTCDESPLFALLMHYYLKLAPPTSVESIKSVIDLLMPRSPSDTVVCVCSPKSDNDDGTCIWWYWPMLDQACHMPAELSHYGIPLVTHLLEYFVSSDWPQRYTADSPLCNAIFFDENATIDFLMEVADEPTLKAWLRRKNSEGLSPLFEAIMNAVADPTRSLELIRRLLNKGASFGTTRPVRTWMVGFKARETARQFVFDSKRVDLIALVKVYDKKQRVRPT